MGLSHQFTFTTSQILIHITLTIGVLLFLGDRHRESEVAGGCGIAVYEIFNKLMPQHFRHIVVQFGHVMMSDMHRNPAKMLTFVNLEIYTT